MPARAWAFRATFSDDYFHFSAGRISEMRLYIMAAFRLIRWALVRREET